MFGLESKLPNSLELNKGKRIEKDLPDILIYLKHWQDLARTLRLVHLLLGISATFFSLLAASQIGSIADEYAKIFAFIAAVSIALMAGFNLGEKSNNVRNAWRLLNAVVIEFNSNPELSQEEVIKVYTKAEELIGDVTFSRG